MTTTKITGLTGSQVRALDEIGVLYEEIGATFATFDGEPSVALDMVTGAIEGWRGVRRGFPIQAAQSIVRKLKGGEGPHVKVTR